MFENYSEKTGRVIYFSRREAGEAGATAIDTVHLLLGLLREDEDRFKRLTGVPELSIIVRARLEAPLKKEYRVPESVDIPIATEYREVLLQAADEARMLSSTNIEPQHLLLAILRMKECLAANILMNIGLTYDALQEAIADEP
jgi:ATP-dependent Clp protease ATP-binding subunit ClpC